MITTCLLKPLLISIISIMSVELVNPIKCEGSLIDEALKRASDTERKTIEKIIDMTSPNVDLVTELIFKNHCVTDPVVSDAIWNILSGVHVQSLILSEFTASLRSWMDHPIFNMDSLTTLEIVKCHGFSSQWIRIISRLHRLEKFTFVGVNNFRAKDPVPVEEKRRESPLPVSQMPTHENMRRLKISRADGFRCTVEFLKRFPNLESFYLGRTLLIANQLETLGQGVTDLSIVGCTSFSPDVTHLKGILTRKELKSLNLTDSYSSLTDPFLKKLSENLPSLENLILDRSHSIKNVSCLGMMTNLKKVSLKDCGYVTGSEIGALIALNPELKVVF